jgi:hypothetical protein
MPATGSIWMIADLNPLLQGWALFPTVPAGLDDFVALVIPELQRRGLFRSAYERATLRAHLGLPRPENQFFPPGHRHGPGSVVSGQHRSSPGSGHGFRRFA